MQLFHKQYRCVASRYDICVIPLWARIVGELQLRDIGLDMVRDRKFLAHSLQSWLASATEIGVSGLQLRSRLTRQEAETHGSFWFCSHCPR